MLGKYYYFFDVDGEFNWLIQAAASTECRLFSDIPKKMSSSLRLFCYK